VELLTQANVEGDDKSPLDLSGDWAFFILACDDGGRVRRLSKLFFGVWVFGIFWKKKSNCLTRACVANKKFN
jgi:hypothetical protein